MSKNLKELNAKIQHYLGNGAQLLQCYIKEDSNITYRKADDLEKALMSIKIGLDIVREHFKYLDEVKHE